MLNVNNHIFDNEIYLNFSYFCSLMPEECNFLLIVLNEKNIRRTILLNVFQKSFFNFLVYNF
jgi:hypothetical protein